MHTKALLCIGALSGMFYLSACGSGSELFPHKDAAASDDGKQDKAPPAPDTADAPVHTPDAPPDVALPEAPVSPAPDAPAIEAKHLDTALETGVDGDPLEGNPAVDSGSPEAGPSEASPPPVLFSSSPCKKSAAASTATAPGVSLKVIDNQAGLEGLQCIAWQRGSTDVQIDLFNYDGACGASWTGSGVLADGRVKLSVDNLSCAVASCGICLYDWSFTLLSAIPANQTVPVSVQVSACPGSSTASSSTAIGADKAGIHCALASYGALAWQASAKNQCGKAGMPCVGSSLCGSGSPSSTGTCDAGLVCDSSAAANEPRCLVSCQQDADCPRTDVWTCASGLCRPKS
jgi:hypothetical protein